MANVSPPKRAKTAAWDLDNSFMVTEGNFEDELAALESAESILAQEHGKLETATRSTTRYMCHCVYM